ncbi:hypothetical protein [Acerihabitans arboris]|uniref:Uncharacterized protein n=1 Tax=Acerihabitans arboris TaxID=2691583 RepID=A0A845SVQ7_9GAMM|nr:hypothetical protein [Acerihabitans arboris]NDL65025.1 hypothetical protein [Acerihabitans arboris]
MPSQSRHSSNRPYLKRASPEAQIRLFGMGKNLLAILDRSMGVDHRVLCYTITYHDGKRLPTLFWGKSVKDSRGFVDSAMDCHNFMAIKDEYCGKKW